MKQARQLLKITRFILRHPIGRRNPGKCIRKFLAWQLSQTIRPRRRIVPFIGKVRLSVTKGMEGATGNIYTGLHEFNEMGFLLHFLRKEDLFADIGANIGSYTMLASGYVGCRSVCFEPVPQTFNSLLENIRINDLGNRVRAENKGVGQKSSKMFFTEGNDSGNHVVANEEEENNVVEVEVISLDNYFQGDCPSLVKIDVEGFETEVLNGMGSVLTDPRLKALIIELNGSGMRYGYKEEDIHRKLLSHEFLPYQYDPFSRSLKPLLSFGSHNTIYVRDVNVVNERLQAAPQVKIFSTIF